MKRIRKKRVKTVQAKTAVEFDDLFNKVSDELTEQAELKWDGELCVHFIYDEVVEIPEDAQDEYLLRGDVYCCMHCPHLEQKNGECRCKYSRGYFTEYEPACKFFYQQLKDGVIEPVGGAR